jgi:hypothetical protein
VNNLRNAIRVAKSQSKITPRLTGWLANHNEGVVVEDTQMADMLVNLASKGESRSGAFHPSQLYRCKREQLFGYYGVEGLKSYNAQLQNIFNDGTWRHMRWQIMLLNAGIIDQVEVGVSMPEYRLTGSMDGLNSEEGWMFELKGTSVYYKVKKEGVLPAHVKQIQAYLMAAKLDKAVVIYEDKARQDWCEFEVVQEQQTIDEVTKILEELNEAVDNNTLTEVLDECKKGSGETFNNCSYAHICREAKTGEQAVELSKAL